MYNVLRRGGVRRGVGRTDAPRGGVYFLRDKVKPTPGPLFLGNCLGGATVNQKI